MRKMRRERLSSLKSHSLILGRAGFNRYLVQKFMLEITVRLKASKKHGKKKYREENTIISYVSCQGQIIVMYVNKIF